MKKQNICINASNLHNGGGVQVATSFISEIVENDDFFYKYNVTIFASKAVNDNLLASGINTSKFKNYEIFEIFGLHALKFDVKKKFKDFDVVFSIFGPVYLSGRIKNHIVGFAQSWILNPNNDVSRQCNLINRLKLRLKFAIQWRFFEFSADKLVVELPHVKKKLMASKGFPSEKIEVVENCFSSIYLDKKKWKPLSKSIESKKDVIRLGYLSRAYMHKNLQIILPVAKALDDMTNTRFEFFVTLNESEWNGFSKEYRDVVKNIGPLSVAQCPSFYNLMDGVVFFSLLECFSATPLEALVMRKPLFASNKDFVRDVCADHATYVDSMNPYDIALKILDWFFNKSQEERINALDRAYSYALSLPTAHDRASSYLRIIQDQLRIE